MAEGSTPTDHARPALRILVVSQYFPPDMGAPAGRFRDFAQRWIAQGHEVTVVTGLPHFPGGRIHEAYRRRAPFFSEELDGVRVARCWIHTRPGRGGRPLAYATFLLTACIRVVFDRSLAADVVITTSPPPSVWLPGLLAAWTRRVPMVLDIRDIWPEAIVQSGRLKNPLVAGIFEGGARLLYRLADRISTVTHGWKARLVELGVRADKIEILPNGVDVETFDAEAEGPLPPAFDALDPACAWFTYAGILNTPQGLDIVVDGFARLRDLDADAYARSQLVLVGEGPREQELRDQSARLGLDRVVFVPRQPRAAVYALLRRSFAVLVTLRPRKDTSTVPSKLYECLASGRPVLFQGAGEGAETLRTAGGGTVVTPGDPDAIASAMASYVRDPERADREGARGRSFVIEGFDRSAITSRFADLLESVRSGART